MENSLKSVLSWFVSREVWRKTKQPCYAKNERPYSTLAARFDDVVNAVKNIAKFHFDQGVQNVATPSLSLLGMTEMTRND